MVSRSLTMTKRHVFCGLCLMATTIHSFLLQPANRVTLHPQLQRYRASPSIDSIVKQHLWRRDETKSIAETKKEVEIIGSSSSEDWLSNGRLSMILEPAEGFLGPAADALDEVTDGYALTYADLSPETPSTQTGRAFLASNLAYSLAGVILTVQGDVTLGLLTELASVASFVYHFAQLDPDSKDDTVRYALLIDYVLAFTSIFVGLGYLIMDGQVPPVEGLIGGGLGLLFFLLGCTICTTGTSYVVVHSLWHIFSAYCAFIIGNIHLEATSTMLP